MEDGQVRIYLTKKKTSFGRNPFSQLNPKILPFTCRIADKGFLTIIKRQSKSKKENKDQNLKKSANKFKEDKKFNIIMKKKQSILALIY